MSTITTSASSFSAMLRATVAPTFPAPPTTVTLRFIVAPCFLAARGYEKYFPSAHSDQFETRVGTRTADRVDGGLTVPVRSIYFDEKKVLHRKCGKPC